MIELGAQEQIMREIARAGDEGLPIAEVGVSLAIRLGLAQLVTITKGDRQRVVATAQGRAYGRRGAFA
jgi:hypothetical protein